MRLCTVVFVHLCCADHVRITHTIFEEMKVKPDDQVFEWGTGCGTKLRYLEDYYNASGMGIDMSPNSLRYAINNTERSVFCLANGKVLGWIPDRAFDQVCSLVQKFRKYTSGTWEFWAQYLMNNDEQWQTAKTTKD